MGLLRIPIISSNTNFARRVASCCCWSPSNKLFSFPCIFWISSFLGDDNCACCRPLVKLWDGLMGAGGLCRFGCFVKNIPSGQRICWHDIKSIQYKSRHVCIYIVIFIICKRMHDSLLVTKYISKTLHKLPRKTKL